jgi:outer membrane protein assembly factor BamA
VFRRLLFFVLLLPLNTQAQLKSQLFFSPDSLPYEHVHIASISFVGNKVTKPAILLRELTFTTGDSIRTTELVSELENNITRILNLQLFSTAAYRVTALDSNAIDIQFEVVEVLYWLAKPTASLADRNFNVWWVEMKHSLSRINVGATVMRNNFRGRNEVISTTLQLGYNRLFEVSYQIPYIDKKLRQGIGFFASFSTGRETSFQTDSNKLLFLFSEVFPQQRIHAKINYTYRKGYASTHEIQLGYTKYNISKALFDKNPNYLNGETQLKFFELNYIYRYNNTDIRIYPLKGYDVKLIVSKTGLGVDRALNRLDMVTQSSYYKKLNPSWSFALVLRARLTFPQTQPYVLNRALGFKNDYVRGYEYYVVDGTHFAMTRSNIRYKLVDKVWYNRYIKFMQHIPFRVYTKAFYDVGYAYNKNAGNSFLNNRMLHGYGLGVDVVLSYYIRCRIEYSFNHIGENSLFLHTTKE